jgi:hypothetical protein
MPRHRRADHSVFTAVQTFSPASVYPERGFYGKTTVIIFFTHSNSLQKLNNQWVVELSAQIDI